jgi:WD40 repeat protein
VFVAGLAPEPTGPPHFSPDGARVAVENEIIDVRSQRRVVVRVDNTETEIQLRFSPDGRTVLGLIDYGSGAIGLQRFSARTGRPVGAGRIVSRPRGGVDFVGEPGLIFALDRRRLITTSVEGPTVVRDPRSFVALDRIAGGTRAAALSPDGRTLLLGGLDGSVRFVDLATGRVRTGAGHHADVVVSAAFDAGGGRAVTAGTDNRVIVWDVARAAPADTLEGQTGPITGLAISPDGRTLYTSALAGRVLVWDLAGDRRLGRPFMLGRSSAIRFGPRQVAFPHAISPDGTVLAVGAADGSVTAIDVRTLRPLYRTHAVNRAILALAFAPHNGPLVAGAFDGTLVLLDARRGTVVQRASGGPGYEGAISFSAAGNRMATLSFTAGIQLWTLRAGRVVGEPRLYLPRSGVTSLSLSPDGHRLAMAGDLGIEVIDTATLARPVRLAASETVRYLVQFTSDGRSIVGGSEQGWARLWSAATLKPVTRPLRGGAAPAQWASLSPDGRTLATGSTDGDVRLFDLTTQRQIGAPLPAVPNQPTAPLFTPDGAYLLALSGAGRGYRWDVRPATWERQACAVGGRTLTRAEWADVLPGRRYAPACG